MTAERLLNHFRDAYRLRVSQVHSDFNEREVNTLVANMPEPNPAQVHAYLAKFAHLPEEERVQHVAMLLCPEPSVTDPFAMGGGGALGILRRAALAQFDRMPEDGDR
jgi:hypothetical protein